MEFWRSQRVVVNLLMIGILTISYCSIVTIARDADDSYRFFHTDPEEDEYKVNFVTNGGNGDPSIHNLRRNWRYGLVPVKSF